MSEQPQDPFDFEQLMKEVEAARNSPEPTVEPMNHDHPPVLNVFNMPPHERTLIISISYIASQQTMTMKELIGSLRNIADVYEKALKEWVDRDKK